MIVLLGAIVGLVAAGGVALVGYGLVGSVSPVSEDDAAREMLGMAPRPLSGGGQHPGGVGMASWIRRYRWRALGAITVFVVGWAATGWLAAGAVLGWVVIVVPLLNDAQKSRRASLALTEALADWADMLRDSMASHAGLGEAIGVTAEVAPEPIKPQVRRLVARAEHQSLSIGLGRFAAEVGDPVADLIVAALSIAADGQARNLPALLGEISAAARAETRMRLRLEASRARTYSSSRVLVAMTFIMSVSLMIFAPEFMAPYSEPVGQIVLMLIGVLFAGALFALVSLSKPVKSPRLLAGVANQGDRATP